MYGATTAAAAHYNSAFPPLPSAAGRAGAPAGTTAGTTPHSYYPATVTASAWNTYVFICILETHRQAGAHENPCTDDATMGAS